MNHWLPHLIFLAGIGQLMILPVSALVPSRLKWREELRSLPRLHRQMHWVYGGYVVLAIIAFAALSIFGASELAKGLSFSARILRIRCCFLGYSPCVANRLRHQSLLGQLVDQGRVLRVDAVVREPDNNLPLGRGRILTALYRQNNSIINAIISAYPGGQDNRQARKLQSDL